MAMRCHKIGLCTKQFDAKPKPWVLLEGVTTTIRPSPEIIHVVLNVLSHEIPENAPTSLCISSMLLA